MCIENMMPIYKIMDSMETAYSLTDTTYCSRDLRIF